MEITAEFLKPYFAGLKKHQAYNETVKLANKLRFHADGENIGELIKDRRPSESKEIQEYRNKIFAAITEATLSKVITSLGKIRRSSDWSIKYDAGALKPSIAQGETLEEYCELNYPQYTSMTKWTFDVYLKSYLVDANAVELVMYKEPLTDVSKYPMPYSVIFNSDQVFDFVDGEYAILYSTDKSEYRLNEREIRYDGDVYYVVNDKVVQRWVQVDAAKNMAMQWEYAHNQEKMPAFKTGGVFQKAMDRINIYKSRISAMVPRLNEAAREYTDLQAEVVQHVHSTLWHYGGQKCVDCSGSGKAIVQGQTIVCQKCKGKGEFPFNPYENIQVDKASMGEQAVPVPPAGYIEKNVEIVKIQDERIDKHIYQALAAINMEFLATTPLQQSGTAKNVDRDELNTFVTNIAEDIIEKMDRRYMCISNYRYAVVVPDVKDRKAMCPKIPVPQSFDLLSSDYILNELDVAKKANLNPVTLTAMEVEYANKKFNNDPLVRDQLKTVLELDPFPGLTDDTKVSRLQNDGITEMDYVISSNIHSFVKRAMEEDKAFLKANLEDKRKVMIKYAEAVIKDTSAAASVFAPDDINHPDNPENPLNKNKGGGA